MLNLSIPKKRSGLGPKQIKWCDENLVGFKEDREAVERVRRLAEDSRRKAEADRQKAA